MNDTDTEITKSNRRDTSSDGAITAYTIFTSITATALFVGSFLSLDAMADKRPAAMRSPEEISAKAYYKFTALCACLFGAEILGGLIWQKLAEKKDKEFTKRIEQEKADSIMTSSDSTSPRAGSLLLPNPAIPGYFQR